MNYFKNISDIFWCIIDEVLSDLTLIIFQIIIGFSFIIHYYDPDKIIIGILWLIIASYHWIGNKDSIIESLDKIKSKLRF